MFGRSCIQGAQNEKKPADNMQFLRNQFHDFKANTWNCLILTLLRIEQYSNGCFPACFKHAAITPLLKKPTLDTSDPCSYRPISNLDFISKILERLFLAHFQPHILACSNFNHHQSAYQPRHSTETFLLSTLDNNLPCVRHWFLDLVCVFGP